MLLHFFFLCIKRYYKKIKTKKYFLTNESMNVDGTQLWDHIHGQTFSLSCELSRRRDWTTGDTLNRQAFPL